MAGLRITPTFDDWKRGQLAWRKSKRCTELSIQNHQKAVHSGKFDANCQACKELLIRLNKTSGK